jgi:hypothetical protein
VARQTDSTGASGRSSVGWRIVQWAATVAFAVQVVAVGATLGASSGALIAGALVPFGFALIRGLAAYGLWHRARWAAWLGGVIAVITVVSTPVFIASAVEAGPHTFANTSFSVVLGWAQVAAGLAFLAGLAVLRLARGVSR